MEKKSKLSFEENRNLQFEWAQQYANKSNCNVVVYWSEIFKFHCIFYKSLSIDIHVLELGLIFLKEFEPK